MNAESVKTVCITGAGGGIGRATALRFATAGTAVYLVDLDEQSLAETAVMVGRYGVPVATLTGDVADEATSAAIVDRCLDSLGGLDAYFANAGTGGPMDSLPRFSLDGLRRILDINLLSAFMAVKYAGNAMVESGGGSIVLTASVAGLNGGAATAIYSASKAGIISLARTAAQELAGTGVRVNAVAPGLIETGMTKFIFDQARQRGSEDKIGQLNPCRRAARSEEVAEAVFFLAGPGASYVNGHTLVVDGGLSSAVPFAPGQSLGWDSGL